MTSKRCLLPRIHDAKETAEKLALAHVHLGCGYYPFGKTHVVVQRLSLGEILHLQGSARDYHTPLYRST